MALDTRADQYIIGKGRFHVAPYNTDGSLQPFRFIGNAPSFTLTPSSDTLEHVSSTGGINVQDRNIVISQALDLAFSSDNISRENLALWIGGSVDTLTQTSATGSTQTYPTVKKGSIYKVGVSTMNPTGLKDITVTQIVQGGTTLVAGTDYVVNSRAGTIAFPTSGATSETTSTVVTYDVAAKTSDQVITRNRTLIVAVMFISDNPDTGAGKIDYEYFLPYVRLAADGDYGLITDDWQSLGFSGSVLQRTDAVGNPIPQVTITPLTAPA